MALRSTTPVMLCAGLLLVSTAIGAGNNANNESISGQLQVAGKGSVNLDGSFVSFGLVVRGTGTMRVVDRGGDASVSVDGTRIAVRTGRTAQVKLRSGKRFYLTGSRFRVTINGRAYAVNASGVGKATLSGSGVYVLNGGDAITWRGRRTLELGVADQRLSLKRRRSDSAADARRAAARKRAEQAKRRARQARKRAQEARKRAQEARRSAATTTGVARAPLTTAATVRPD